MRTVFVRSRVDGARLPLVIPAGWDVFVFEGVRYRVVRRRGVDTAVPC